MKKLLLASLATMLCCGMIAATEMSMTSMSSTSTTASASVSIPTGTFFNEYDFVYVQSNWVRIVINGNRAEYSIRSAEYDPQGNYALVLSNGDSMTIYSDGKSLYYGGKTYSKK